MLFYSDNPYNDLANYDLYRARREARYPHCAVCGRVIHRRWFEVGGDCMCRECADEACGHDVEVYDD